MKLLMMMIFSVAALASAPKFEKTRLFVKTNNPQGLSNNKFVTKVKHLFKNNYLVTTTDVLDFEKSVKNKKSMYKTYKSYYGEKRELPRVETTKLEQFNFSFFNDPLVNKIWSFNDDSGYGVSVNKTYLSPLNVDKEEIIVAVVDTGVDYNHEDLKDVMWKNKGEIEGNGIDDDGNGYIDDIYGINPLVKDANGNTTTDPMASHAHGTHVSGTIAATQNNNIGIAGIASNVKIMAIRTVPDAADETDADIVESFLYAAKNGAKLINCSFGKSVNEGGMIVNETMDHIGSEYGAMVFAAAGNDSSWFGKHDIDKKPKYPAAFPSDYMVVVASTESRGGLSSFSNVGKIGVDVAAPGSSIYSTVPGNKYAGMSGTSMATPTTVGVAAQILSNFPELTPAQLKNILIESVTKVDAFTPYMVSGGRVNLYNALEYTLNNYSQL